MENNIEIPETVMDGPNEHREAVVHLAKSLITLSTSSAFFLNQGYGQCAVLGEIRAYDKGDGIYHIFLKNQTASRSGWSKCTQ